MSENFWECYIEKDKDIEWLKNSDLSKANSKIMDLILKSNYSDGEVDKFFDDNNEEYKFIKDNFKKIVSSNNSIMEILSFNFSVLISRRLEAKWYKINDTTLWNWKSIQKDTDWYLFISKDNLKDWPTWKGNKDTYLAWFKEEHDKEKDKKATDIKNKQEGNDLILKNDQEILPTIVEKTKSLKVDNDNLTRLISNLKGYKKSQSEKAYEIFQNHYSPLIENNDENIIGKYKNTDSKEYRAYIGEKGLNIILIDSLFEYMNLNELSKIMYNVDFNKYSWFTLKNDLYWAIWKKDQNKLYEFLMSETATNIDKDKYLAILISNITDTKIAKKILLWVDLKESSYDHNSSIIKLSWKLDWNDLLEVINSWKLDKEQLTQIIFWHTRDHLDSYKNLTPDIAKKILLWVDLKKSSYDHNSSIIKLSWKLDWNDLLEAINSWKLDKEQLTKIIFWYTRDYLDSYKKLTPDIAKKILLKIKELGVTDSDIISNLEVISNTSK